MSNDILFAEKSKYPSYKNDSDFEAACKEHMQNNGLPCDTDRMEFNSTYKRYSASGKRSLPEWYIGSYIDDGLIVTYGSWPQQVKYTFVSFAKDPYNYEKSEKIKKQIKEHHRLASELTAKVQAQAIKDVKDIWLKASSNPLCPEHSLYINEKGIKPYGIKYGSYHSIPAIIVPLRGTDNEVYTLEYIFSNPDKEGKERFPKRFETGAPKRGNYHSINNEQIKNGDIVYVVEGYATGVSVYEAIKAENIKVVCAMDAGNIKACVPLLKEKFPKCDFIIAGDSDEVGRCSAIAVAKEFGLQVVFPVIERELGKDFNDVAKKYGTKCVMEQLKKTEKFEDPTESLEKIALSLLNKEEPCDCFSLEHIPPVLKDHVEALCSSNAANPIAVLGSLLTTASAFIGKRFIMKQSEFDDGFFDQLHVNTWMLFIAPSGQFKSTAFNAGSRLCVEHRIGLRNYSKGMVEELRKVQAIKGNKSNELIDKEQFLISQLAEIDRNNVLFPDRTTPEALLQALGNGRSGAIFNSEFGCFIADLAKSANAGLMGMLTKFYDVVALSEDVTKTQGSNFIERPFISIFGVSTLDWMNDSFKSKDVRGGFYTRMLIYSLPPLKERPSSLPRRKYPCKENTYEPFKTILMNARKINSRIYRVAPSAIQYYDEIFNQIYDLKDSFDSDDSYILGGYINRWPATILKIAIIMELFLDPNSDEISKAAIQGAYSFVYPAIKSTLYLFQGELGESEFESQQNRIFNWICTQTAKNKGKPPTHKELYESRSGRRVDLKIRENILKSLIESGKIKENPGKTRKETTYEVLEKNA